MNNWKNLVDQETNKAYWPKLLSFLDREAKHYAVYPAPENVFRAFLATSYNDVRVVIVGQDPYHGPCEANGLCFAVNEGVVTPPSLINILAEVAKQTGRPAPCQTLAKWADNGVLLLNTVLTVRRDCAGSHQNQGWEVFTDAVLHALNEREQPIIFLLWGAKAKIKRRLITAPHHRVLQSAHPSPLAAYRGFFGNGHFAQVEQWLDKEIW